MNLVVKLSAFEGPMDLLLHLVRKAEINIEDIFVSQITEQYLQIIHQAEQLDMEVAGEFITMAAMLLEIKSRAMLPKPQIEDVEAEDELDPEEMLIQQLTSDQMRRMESEGTAHRYKLPEEILPQKPQLDLTGVTAQSLYDAFSSLLLRRAGEDAPSTPARTIRRDAFTVPDRMAYLRRMLRSRGVMRFDELFDDACTRAQIVVTFMALLEMMRLGRVGVQQNGTFSDICITWRQQAQEGSV